MASIADLKRVLKEWREDFDGKLKELSESE